MRYMRFKLYPWYRTGETGCNPDLHPVAMSYVIWTGSIHGRRGSDVVHLLPPFEACGFNGEIRRFFSRPLLDRRCCNGRGHLVFTPSFMRRTCLMDRACFLLRPLFSTSTFLLLHDHPRPPVVHPRPSPSGNRPATPLLCNLAYLAVTSICVACPSNLAPQPPLRRVTAAVSRHCTAGEPEGPRAWRLGTWT
jgi:hypothetical protein